MGPLPEGALNSAAWKMIRALVGSDPALNQAAWETLRGIMGLLPNADIEASLAAQPTDEADATDATSAVQ